MAASTRLPPKAVFAEEDVAEALLEAEMDKLDDALEDPFGLATADMRVGVSVDEAWDAKMTDLESDDYEGLPEDFEEFCDLLNVLCPYDLSKDELHARASFALRDLTLELKEKEADKLNEAGLEAQYTYLLKAGASIRVEEAIMEVLE